MTWPGYVGGRTHLLHLHSQLATLGGQLEHLVLRGVHAAAVNVADLALPHAARARRRVRPAPARGTGYARARGMHAQQRIALAACDEATL